MPPAPKGRAARSAGRTVAVAGQTVLFVVGFVCLGAAGAAWTQAHLYQARQERAFERALAAKAVPTGTARALTNAAAPPAAAPAETDDAAALDPAILGKLEVPRLALSVMVREGDDAQTLKVAAGHVPGTAFPWQEGNVGIAGHRDSFFRKLRLLKKNDALVLTTPRGRFAYRVDRLLVVMPEQVEVLSGVDGPRLTLITCYPFSYTGSAPQRFVVGAKRVR